MNQPPADIDTAKVVVIPKQEAVFWMDGQGRWHNRHGLFEHRKLIAHFNAAIAWDRDGYFVAQQNGDLVEKVYFQYEVTALFAVDVAWTPEASLWLNTGRRSRLVPENLFVCEYHLYMDHGLAVVKFGPSALMKLWKRLDLADDNYWLTLGGRQYKLDRRS